MWPSLACGISLTCWAPTTQVGIVSLPLSNSYGYYWRQKKKKSQKHQTKRKKEPCRSRSCNTVKIVLAEFQNHSQVLKSSNIHEVIMKFKRPQISFAKCQSMREILYSTFKLFLTEGRLESISPLTAIYGNHI